MPVIALSQHRDDLENQRPNPKPNRKMHKERMNVQHRFESRKHRSAPPRAGIILQSAVQREAEFTEGTSLIALIPRSLRRGKRRHKPPRAPSGSNRQQINSREHAERDNQPRPLGQPTQQKAHQHLQRGRKNRHSRLRPPHHVLRHRLHDRGLRHNSSERPAAAKKRLHRHRNHHNVHERKKSMPDRQNRKCGEQQPSHAHPPHHPAHRQSANQSSKSPAEFHQPKSPRPRVQHVFHQSHHQHVRAKNSRDHAGISKSHGHHRRLPAQISDAIFQLAKKSRIRHGLHQRRQSRLLRHCQWSIKPRAPRVRRRSPRRKISAAQTEQTPSRSCIRSRINRQNSRNAHAIIKKSHQRPSHQPSALHRYHQRRIRSNQFVRTSHFLHQRVNRRPINCRAKSVKKHHAINQQQSRMRKSNQRGRGPHRNKSRQIKSNRQIAPVHAINQNSSRQRHNQSRQRGQNQHDAHIHRRAGLRENEPRDAGEVHSRPKQRYHHPRKKIAEPAPRKQRAPVNSRMCGGSHAKRLIVQAPVAQALLPVAK